MLDGKPRNEAESRHGQRKRSEILRVAASSNPSIEGMPKNPSPAYHALNLSPWM